MDIGQPKDFITGTRLHLASLRKHNPEVLYDGEGVRGNVFTVSCNKVCQNTLTLYLSMSDISVIGRAGLQTP